MPIKYKMKPHTWPPNPAIHTPWNLLGTPLFQVPNLQREWKTFTLKVNSKKILNAYKETLGSRLAQENRIYIKTEETRLQTKQKQKCVNLKSAKFKLKEKVWQWVLRQTS